MARTIPYLVGIDIGSSKIGVLIAQRTEAGGLEVVGRGLAPNRGCRRGNIVNVEATVAALKQACEEAEVMAGIEIASAYVGIAGDDVRSLNSRGMVTVARQNREISHQDIRRALDAAKNAPLPPDREILHVIPQEFIVDDQEGINDPMGMLGRRLDVLVHLVTGNATKSRTLLTCVNRAGIEVTELVFEPLATGEAVLTPDERELGVLLVDIGSGTTEYALVSESEVRHSAVLPVGAGHFTNDLAMVLKTPFAEAEKLKLKYGCCLAALVDGEEGVTVPAVAGGSARVLPRRQLSEILEPRAEEMFELVKRDLDRAGFSEAPRAGIVLTGGGAQLEGLLEVAEQSFDCSVRYGLPHGLNGLVDVISSPTWCTASGLLLYGLAAENRREKSGRRPGLSMRGMVHSLRSMFADLL
jgi:cell division protein FtsA